MSARAPAPLLEVEGLTVDYGSFRAVEDATFRIFPGETFGLVGESGSGKSSIGRAVLRLVEPTRGAIRFAGTDLRALTGRALRAFRRNLQVVFQDPAQSLDPRQSIAAIVTEGLSIHGMCREGGPLGTRRARRARAAELLSRTGLAPELLDRFPHELSGGQRQRVSLARALAVEPRLIVLDECVSALDVSVQAQVLNLLGELREERGLSYLFISHDLAVVRHMADRVAVMRGGRIVEQGATEALCRAPAHEYTRRLIEATPTLARAE